MHEPCTASEPLIGITEAARQIGISHSTLSCQVKRGQVRSHGGKVLLSEVIYDREHNLDQSGWRARRKDSQARSASALGRDGRTRKAVHGRACSAALDAPSAPTAGACHDTEITPPRLAALGHFLDIQEERCGDPEIVGSVMILTGTEVLMAEAGRHDGGDRGSVLHDESPIGPCRMFAGNGMLLDIGLVRKLGRVLENPDQCEPPLNTNDPIEVAEGLILMGIDIFKAEIESRRATAGEPE